MKLTLAEAAISAGAVLEAPQNAANAGALQVCGYSTNPKYADLLMQLVRDYTLTQFDAPPPPFDK